MSAVDTTTTLPAGTPVMEIDAATARDIANGNVFGTADLADAVESDFGAAVAQIDAGAAEAFVVIKITRD